MGAKKRRASVGSLTEPDYRAPWWLPGGHLQTIYARHLGRQYSVSYRRERWETPDNDFIDLDWLGHASGSGKLIIMFHGLEGYSQSHYARSLMAMAARYGWRGVVPHFRGCSGEANRLLRCYHSGDSREIDWILRRVKTENPQNKICAVGISLGGNMLLKWLGEEGSAACGILERAAAISAPLDLAAAATELDFGLKRVLYTSHFLRSMRPRALAKVAAHPSAIDPRAIRASVTFRQFDDLFTAPVHGFKDAADYWRRSSSRPWLDKIAVPTLILNARNDPFLPASALPSDRDVSDAVTLEFPRTGGHVGFVSGKFPGHFNWLPERILRYFSE